MRSPNYTVGFHGMGVASAVWPAEHKTAKKFSALGRKGCLAPGQAW
jgi:hypothetical protein